ncbi:hypothetical protein D3C81_2160370 [compost metagenome]
MPTALDQATLLHFVEQAHQGDRLDLQQVGQAFLMNAFIEGQLGQHLPLRAGQVEVARALFEALAHQPRHIMHKETHGRTHR